MSKKLFISNLDFEVSSEQLREMFSAIGTCTSVVVALDKESRRSKGFAFVEMENEEHAARAIEELNNKQVNGRPMKVVEDRGKAGITAPSFSAGSEERGEGGGGRRYEPLPAIQRTQLFKRKKKLDPFIEDPKRSIDYKETALLNKFVSERGKILGRRLTGLTSYNQRKITKAIKRAQNAGLMSFTNVK